MLYEIQSKHNTFTGIIAGTSIEDYQNNVIKKHEDTLQFRVELFKIYLHQTGFNTEPVLITYPDSTEINTFIAIHKTDLFTNFPQRIKKNIRFGKLKRKQKLIFC